MGCSHGWSNAEPVVIVISLISTAPAGAAELEGQDADFLTIEPEQNRLTMDG